MTVYLYYRHMSTIFDDTNHISMREQISYVRVTLLGSCVIYLSVRLHICYVCCVEIMVDILH